MKREGDRNFKSLNQAYFHTELLKTKIKYEAFETIGILIKNTNLCQKMITEMCNRLNKILDRVCPIYGEEKKEEEEKLDGQEGVNLANFNFEDAIKPKGKMLP